MSRIGQPFSCRPTTNARSAHTMDYRKPRLRPSLAESKVRQIGPRLNPSCLNGFDVPSRHEGIVQFLFRHSAWPSSSRLLVAEAHQEQLPARLQDCRQARQVISPILIGKNVKQTAVDHVIESLGPVLESQSVF